MRTELLELTFSGNLHLRQLLLQPCVCLAHSRVLLAHSLVLQPNFLQFLSTAVVFLCVLLITLVELLHLASEVLTLQHQLLDLLTQTIHTYATLLTILSYSLFHTRIVIIQHLYDIILPEFGWRTLRLLQWSIITNTLIYAHYEIHILLLRFHALLLRFLQFLLQLLYIAIQLLYIAIQLLYIAIQLSGLLFMLLNLFIGFTTQLNDLVVG
jgi:hypothetical protein